MLSHRIVQLESKLNRPKTSRKSGGGRGINHQQQQQQPEKSGVYEMRNTAGTKRRLLDYTNRDEDSDNDVMNMGDHDSEDEDGDDTSWGDPQFSRTTARTARRSAADSIDAAVEANEIAEQAARDAYHLSPESTIDDRIGMNRKPYPSCPMPLGSSVPRNIVYDPADLPSKDIIDKLVNTYFDRTMVYRAFIHPDTFKRQLEHKAVAPSFLYAMMACSVRFIPYEMNVRGMVEPTAADEFLMRAKAFLPRVAEKPRLEDIQMYMLLSQEFMMRCDGQAAWLYKSQGLMLAQNMALDRLDERYDAIKATLLPAEWTRLETARRIWWHMFLIETVSSMGRGRRPSLNPDDFMVNYPSSDELWLMGGQNASGASQVGPGGGPHNALMTSQHSASSYFVQVLSLLNRVISLTNCNKTLSRDPVALLEYSELYNKCTLWYRMLPNHMKISPANLRLSHVNPLAFANIALTHVMYHATLVSLSRSEMFEMADDVMKATMVQRARDASLQMTDLLRSISHVEPLFFEPFFFLSVFKSAFPHIDVLVHRGDPDEVASAEEAIAIHRNIMERGARNLPINKFFITDIDILTKMAREFLGTPQEFKQIIMLTKRQGITMEEAISKVQRDKREQQETNQAMDDVVMMFNSSSSGQQSFSSHLAAFNFKPPTNDIGGFSESSSSPATAVSSSFMNNISRGGSNSRDGSISSPATTSSGWTPRTENANSPAVANMTSIPERSGSNSSISSGTTAVGSINGKENGVAIPPSILTGGAMSPAAIDLIEKLGAAVRDQDSRLSRSSADTASMDPAQRMADIFAPLANNSDAFTSVSTAAASVINDLNRNKANQQQCATNTQSPQQREQQQQQSTELSANDQRSWMQLLGLKAQLQQQPQPAQKRNLSNPGNLELLRTVTGVPDLSYSEMASMFSTMIESAQGNPMAPMDLPASNPVNPALSVGLASLLSSVSTGNNNGAPLGQLSLNALLSSMGSPTEVQAVSQSSHPQSGSVASTTPQSSTSTFPSHGFPSAASMNSLPTRGSSTSGSNNSVDLFGDLLSQALSTPAGGLSQQQQPLLPFNPAAVPVNQVESINTLLSKYANPALANGSTSQLSSTATATATATATTTSQTPTAGNVATDPFLADFISSLINSS
ncbi:hypothetical protein GQ42DRAFT_160391 [Ramicandelaber brevisporus]|nr:hypothetical protein GQ42DRAFT_160391 [Ramicandelaber brevisporus]